MAILAQIRKRPIYLIMIIGMALFAFVLSDVFKGNGPERSSIGSVDGEEISTEKFSRQLESQKNNGTSSLQNVKTVWNNIVREQVYKTQLDKAGIVIGEKDIWDSMTNNTSIQNDPRFKDESGLFDENKLKEFIATLKDNKDTQQGKQQWQGWVNYEKSIKSNLEQSTYNDLVKSGLTASLKEGERKYLSENTSANIKYVFESYSSIKDDEITISDSEISSYMNAHPTAFEVEATTEIDYVKFAVEPSKEDIEKVRLGSQKILNDREEWNKAAQTKENVIGFINTKNIKEFVNEYSDTPYVNKVYFKTDLPGGVYDSISTLQNGGVYGPYRDGEYFKLAKIIDKEGLRSAKTRHILVAYAGATRANPEIKRSREEAEKLANKIKSEINATNFIDKVKEFSDGPSATKGGDIGWSKENGALAEEYKKYIFSNKKGDIGLVETSFGFHIIKIDDTKTEDGLNLGIVVRKIEASEATESKIYQAAETFASDLTNGKNLIELAKNNNYKIQSATDIATFSENIAGLGNQREIVKWTFDKESKAGDVKRFDLDNGDYAIAIIKNKYPKGLMTLKKAKFTISPILTKLKKAKLIRDKMKGATIDEIAKSVNKSVATANEISIANPALTTGGRDIDIIGAIFYMKEGDLKLLDGNNGVYAFKIIKKNTPYELKRFDTYTNNITTELKNKSSKIYDVLKKSSSIEDNRTLFY